MKYISTFPSLLSFLLPLTAPQRRVAGRVQLQHVVSPDTSLLSHNQLWSKYCCDGLTGRSTTAEEGWGGGGSWWSSHGQENHRILFLSTLVSTLQVDQRFHSQTHLVLQIVHSSSHWVLLWSDWSRGVIRGSVCVQWQDSRGSDDLHEGESRGLARCPTQHCPCPGPQEGEIQ